MNSNPILIVAGEPYSIFSEILFKSLKKNRFKKPLILITSFNLIKDQAKKLNYKCSINLINENFKNHELKKNTINLINVNFNYKKIFDKISNSSKVYNQNFLKKALKLLKKKKFFRFHQWTYF